MNLPAPKTATRSTTLLMMLTVAGAALIVHARSWSHPFVYDDVFAVRDHPVVRGDEPWPAILTSPYWPRTFTPDPLFRPVTLASFRLNADLFGMSARNFHVANSILHALASTLVALAAMVVWRRAAAGWMAGLPFALHPVHTEAVALIVGRSELLTLIFLLAMLILHLRHARTDRRPSLPYHLGLSALYALACFSKEHGVLAIALIAAIDFNTSLDRSKCPETPRQLLRRLASSHYLGLIIVAASIFFVRWLLFRWQTSLPSGVDNSAFNPMDNAQLAEKLLTPFKLLALSLQLILLPVNLCPIWAKGGLNLTGYLLDPPVLAGIAAGALLAAAAIRLRRHPAFAFVTGALVFLLIPCHFIPVASWFFGERWLYTPTALFLIFASGLARAWPRVATAATCLIALAWATETWRYQNCWASDEAIVHAVVDRQPRNFVGLREMCTLLDLRDSLATGGSYVRLLVQCHPDETATWYFQAKLLAESGHYPEARLALDRYWESASLPDLSPQLSELVHRLENADRHD